MINNYYDEKYKKEKDYSKRKNRLNNYYNKNKINQYKDKNYNIILLQEKYKKQTINQNTITIK